MFSSIGWSEIIVLALAALFIFGPERLPDLAKDAAGGLKRVRTAWTGVRGHVHDSLGDDLAHLRDVDLRRYHPKTFLREHLLEEDAGPPAPRAAGANGSSGAGATASRRVPPAGRDRSVPAPIDADAT
ncbi:twin-arginine translocase TatA/TatE family subunit [Blastococcus capsensis]|uniref:twin-arginine translocase TatA/TatE family subunit n=1 Tax=Blastococcus capsensis TaxID=1564163 RepID=UPI002541D3A9|nr:twin-arginine translocase TatA/TatE family subunit [Blastococcus capsensis]MDK3255642.1 twin-arginine translocase TatA/TatE family subunit [Blastococcus capsensis]